MLFITIFISIIEINLHKLLLNHSKDFKVYINSTIKIIEMQLLYC